MSDDEYEKLLHKVENVSSTFGNQPEGTLSLEKAIADMKELAIDYEHIIFAFARLKNICDAIKAVD